MKEKNTDEKIDRLDEGSSEKESLEKEAYNHSDAQSQMKKYEYDGYEKNGGGLDPFPEDEETGVDVLNLGSDWKFDDENDSGLVEENYEQNEEIYKIEDQKLKDSINYFIATKTVALEAIFDKKHEDNEYNPLMDKDYQVLIHFAEDGSIYTRFMRQAMGEYVPQPRSYSTLQENITNREIFENYKKKVSEYYDRIDDYIDENVHDTDVGLKIAAYSKAISSRTVKRALKGYPPGFINSRTPLGVTPGEVLTGALSNGMIKNKVYIKKYGSSFPAYDLTILGEDQIDTLVDYWEEKEKGKLNTQKILNYRRTLYTQSVRMLNYIAIIDDIGMDRELNELLMDEGVCPDNPPFEFTTIAGRGLGHLKSSLEAYKTGLENGWDIDDIPVLAVFKYLTDRAVGKTQHTLSGNVMSDVKFYDKPRYDNDEHKEFLSKMNSFYEYIKKNPITSAEERNRIIDTINKMVVEADSRGYFPGTQNDNATVNYFKLIHRNVRRRDAKIERQQEPACHNVLIKKELKPSEQIDQILYRMNSKRSVLLFWNRESSKHTKLRNIAEDLRNSADYVYKFSEMSPARDRLNVAYNYLNSLDEAIYRSEKYIKDKGNPNTPAGKERLRGAKELKKIAEKERIRILKNIRVINYEVNKYADNTSLDTVRMTIIKENAEKAEKTFTALQGIPEGAEAREAIIDSLADIVVRNMVEKSVPVRTVMNKMGINVFKNKIKKSEEFKNMMQRKLTAQGANGNYILQGLDAITLQSDLMTDTFFEIYNRNEKIGVEKEEKNYKAMQKMVRQKPKVKRK